MVLISNLYNKWLKKFILKNELYFFAASEKITPTIQFFFDECHFTELGAKKLAYEFYKYLIKNIKFT